MYRKERKQSQKSNKFEKYSYSQDNAQKFKGDYIPLESASPPPFVIPGSRHPRRKKTNTKPKSTSAATYHHTERFIKSQKEERHSKTQKISSRVTNILSARVNEYRKLTGLDNSCCCSSFSTSSHDIDTQKVPVCCVPEPENLSPVKIKTLQTVFQKQKSGDFCACSEKLDEVCCISETTQILPQTRRRTGQTSFQKQKCECSDRLRKMNIGVQNIPVNKKGVERADSVCGISESVQNLSQIEKRTAETSIQQQKCNDICTCSEFSITSAQLFLPPITEKSLKAALKKKKVTIQDQEDSSESCNSSCSDISTTSSTIYQHIEQYSRRHTNFKKLNSFEKNRASTEPVKRAYQQDVPRNSLETCKRGTHLSKLHKYSNLEPQYQRSKSRPSQSISRKPVPYQGLRPQDRTPLLSRLQPSNCLCAEESSELESDESLLLPCPSKLSSIGGSESESEHDVSDDDNDNTMWPKDCKCKEFYDPHMHRTPENPTNYFETLVHLVKCVLGTGILAMPQSFAKAGFIPGTIFTVITGVMITHCLRMLILAQYVVCKRKGVPMLNYSESMQACLETGPPGVRRFSKISGILVNVFLVILQLGICCIYICFIAGSMKKIVDPHYCIPIELHMLIITGPLIIANCIPNLKVLAPFSAFANVLILVSLAIIIYYLLTAKKKTTEPLDLWGSIYTFPLFFGTVLFALTAVAVVTTLENNMKTPKDFVKPLGVLNIGMLLIILIYVLVGSIGYLFCRSKCSDSIIYDLPENSPMVVAVLIMYSVGMLISYVLQCFVPIEILRKTILKKQLTNASETKKKFWDYFLRIFICLLTFMVALAIPRFGFITWLLGVLCITSLTLFFPTIMEMVNSKGNYGRFKVILIKDILLLIIGIVGFIIGSITVIVDMIRPK